VLNVKRGDPYTQCLKVLSDVGSDLLVVLDH